MRPNGHFKAQRSGRVIYMIFFFFHLDCLICDHSGDDSIYPLLSICIFVFLPRQKASHPIYDTVRAVVKVVKYNEEILGCVVTTSTCLHEREGLTFSELASSLSRNDCASDWCSHIYKPSSAASISSSCKDRNRSSSRRASLSTLSFFFFWAVVNFGGA